MGFYLVSSSQQPQAGSGGSSSSWRLRRLSQAPVCKWQRVATPLHGAPSPVSFPCYPELPPGVLPGGRHGVAAGSVADWGWDSDPVARTWRRPEEESPVPGAPQVEGSNPHTSRLWVLGQSLNLSEPRLLHLQNKDGSTYSRGTEGQWGLSVRGQDRTRHGAVQSIR